MEQKKTKLIKAEVQEIKVLLKTGHFSNDLDCIAKAFGTSKRAITDIQKRRTWAGVRAIRKR